MNTSRLHSKRQAEEILRLIGCRLFQYSFISLARKPLRPFKMALPAPIGPKLIGCRIAVQHDLRDFLPICILGLPEMPITSSSTGRRVSPL